MKKRTQKIMVWQREILTKSSRETQALGEETGKRLFLMRPATKALVLALSGNLGGGKTTFIQGLAKGLGVKEKILSPTFVLMRRHKTAKRGVFFFHIDCYRMENPKEALTIGYKELLGDKNNILAIEWPEKIDRLIPSDALRINFDFIDDKTRKISFSF